MTREVIAVPVQDLPMTTLALGWLPQAVRPEIAAFARTVQRVAAERTGTLLASELAPTAGRS